MSKTVYLTIDDGPSKDMKMKVDYLLSKNIPAVWFCIGVNLEKRPNYALYAIKKGHIIGNHSYNRPHFSNLTLEESYKQIKKTDEIIDRIYQKANVIRPAKFFRFPYGDKGGIKYNEIFKPHKEKGKIKKEKIQEFLKKLGYIQPKFKGITYKYYKNAGLLDDVDWYWTYDAMEYYTFEKENIFGIDSLEKVFERMDEDVPEGCRGLNYLDSEEIILIHDMSKSTSIFKPIIERLISKELVFKLPSF